MGGPAGHTGAEGVAQAMAEAEGRGQVDPYKLLRILEDVTDRHARTIQSLDKALERLERDPYNESLQSLVMTYLKRLRVLRKRMEAALDGEVRLEGIESEVVDNIATLSEYMIIVGYMYEEDVLRRALAVAGKGAELIGEDEENIREDLESVRRLSERLQSIVDNYY